MGTVLVGLDTGLDPYHLVRDQTTAYESQTLACHQVLITTLTKQELLDCCFHTVA